MSNYNNKKIEPWRVIVFVCAVVFIVVMWAKKDIAAIYATMPKEQIAPLIITALAVSLCKIALIAGGVLLIRWIVRKIKKK